MLLLKNVDSLSNLINGAIGVVTEFVEISGLELPKVFSLLLLPKVHVLRFCFGCLVVLVLLDFGSRVVFGSRLLRLGCLRVRIIISTA